MKRRQFRAMLTPTPVLTVPVLQARAVDGRNGIYEGMRVADAFGYFRANVNQKGTLFSRDHWLLPIFEQLRLLLTDPLPEGQAEALWDMLHGRNGMHEVLPWLEAGCRVSWAGHVSQMKAERDRLMQEFSSCGFMNEHDCVWHQCGRRGGFGSPRCDCAVCVEWMAARDAEALDWSPVESELPDDLCGLIVL